MLHFSRATVISILGLEFRQRIQKNRTEIKFSTIYRFDLIRLIQIEESDSLRNYNTGKHDVAARC